MAHDHHHDHAHAHAAGHVHAPADFGAAFAVGIALNLAFVVGEAAFGVLGHSVALQADAGHNLADVLGLAAAWLASALAKRAPSARFTYGLRGSSILAALANAVLLMIAVGAISWEAILRLTAPAPVDGATMMVVAAVGIAVNGATALLFMAGRKDDLNLRAAFLHMAGDALVAAGVVVAGLVVWVSGWLWVDPLVSLVVNALIVVATWGALREALGLSLAAVPARLDPAEVRNFLAARDGVSSLHDLHIWAMSTTETALTCHLVMPAGPPGDAYLHALCAEIGERFGIRHATVQIERDASACALAPDEVV